MLIIENGNVIKITRGDTLTLTVNLTKAEQPYTPIADDSIRFALAIGYVGQSGYRLILTKDIPIDTLTFTLSAEETQSLVYPKYNYDIQITHADGCVDTVISSTMVMLAEVE